MRARDTSCLLTTVTFLGLGACDYARDSVAPSCYGTMAQTQAGRGSTTSGAMTATGSNPMSPSNTPSTGASGAPGLSAGTNAPSTPTAGSKAPTAPTMMSGVTNNPPANPGNMAAAKGCDLTGPWLFSMHKVTDGLGNLQYVHDYMYLEIKQQADSFMVTRGLVCGVDVVGGGDFAITVTYPPATTAGMMNNVKLEGRTGTSKTDANGCNVHFDKQYIVMGATLPYYLDPQTTLPTAEQKAMGGTPGWEDWDNDGHPGITGICEGTVAGEIYTAAREWNELTGTVPSVDSAFKLPMQWDVEPNVMAFDGSPFLSATAVRAADASSHFAEFARLQPSQVAGDDATLCKSLVKLAPMLTPTAAGM